MKDPILSICMPTYNRVAHIKRQYKYFEKEIMGIKDGLVEIIFSNNASTDGTTDFLNQIEGEAKWLAINQNEQNIGGVNNMRLMLKMAKGKYVWFPGDDDYLICGLVKKIIDIIESNDDLTYIYLSRRTINEENKKVDCEGKVHRVNYDVAEKLTYESIVHLLMENFGDLKFQTSSIVRTDIAIQCEEEGKIFSSGAQEDCHSIFRSFRAMQMGKSFFVSQVSVLNGNEISWNDVIIDIMSVYDPEFSLGLKEFGISQKDCEKICDRQYAAAFLFYLTHKTELKKWIERGKPGWKNQTLIISAYLIFRKFLRKFNLSKDFCIKTVDIDAFGIQVA